MYHLAGWHLFKHVHKYVKETMYYCSTTKLIQFHLLDFLILNMVSIIRSSNNTLTHIHNHLNRHITNTHKHTHTHILLSYQLHNRMCLLQLFLCNAIAAPNAVATAVATVRIRFVCITIMVCMYCVMLPGAAEHAFVSVFGYHGIP